MKLAVLILCFLASSCITREEINATLWENNFSAEEVQALCIEKPILKQIGFYRKLNDGNIEFVSMCDKASYDFYSIPSEELKNLLDKALPQKEKAE